MNFKGYQINLRPGETWCMLSDKEGNTCGINLVELNLNYNRFDPLNTYDIEMKGFISNGGNGVGKQAITRHNGIKKIIVNPPKTIVLWQDGTKTVVTCGEKDHYSPRVGALLCCLKKLLGNTSRSLNDMLKEIERELNNDD